MKTIKSIIPTLFALLILFTSCESDLKGNDKKTNIICQNRYVNSFNGIEVSHGIQVELTIDENESVTIIADSSFMENIITKTKDNILKVYIKSNKFNFKKEKIVVKISAMRLNSIEVSSGSNISSKDTIEGEKLTLNCSSGASLSIYSKTIESSCSVNSGSCAFLHGITKNFKGEASSGATIKAYGLNSINTDLNVSSGANISITVKENIKAEASSGGSVHYKGSPSIKDFKKSSGGSVSAN